MPQPDPPLGRSLAPGSLAACRVIDKWKGTPLHCLFGACQILQRICESEGLMLGWWITLVGLFDFPEDERPWVLTVKPRYLNIMLDGLTTCLARHSTPQTTAETEQLIAVTILCDAVLRYKKHHTHQSHPIPGLTTRVQLPNEL